MPVRVSGTKWFVRVDGPQTFLTDKCKVMSQWIDCTNILAVYHQGGTKENPHSHMLVEMMSELQKQSFDVRIKTLFETKGNGYSTKLWDGLYDEGAGSYLFHEGEDDSLIIVNKGFTELHINNFKDIAKRINKVIAKNKEKASVRLPERAILQFKDATHDHDLEFSVFQFMMSEIKNGNAYHPGQGILIKYVKETMLRLCPNTRFDEYCLREYENLFLRR